MKVLDLFKIYKNASLFDAVLALSLAFIYGLAVPIATIHLKNQAVGGFEFLFFGQNLFSAICFWLLAIFSAAVSLFKVFEFLRTAFNNKLLAILNCAALEFAFLHSSGAMFAFFFTCIAIANIVQAAAGFIAEGQKNIKTSDQDNDEGFWVNPGSKK